MVFIFDIDGTLFDPDHRLHYIKSDPKNWDKFFEAAFDDPPILPTVKIAQALLQSNHQLVYLTGRPEKIRLSTRILLDKYHLSGALYMRKDRDYREDFIIKAELFNNHFHADTKIGGVFEDRQQVCDMWRAKGLRVYQVAEGRY